MPDVSLTTCHTAQSRDGSQSHNGLSVRTLTFGGWVDAINDHLTPLEISRVGEGSFHGDLQVQTVGSSVLALINTSEISVRRTVSQARALEAGMVKIMWQLKGRGEVEQKGSVGRIEAGHVSVTDTAEPYCMLFPTDSKLAILYLPWDRHTEWRSLVERGVGLAFTPDAATRAALAGLLTLLEGPTDATAAATVDSISDLVLASLSNRQSLEPKKSKRRRRLFQEARRYVMRNLEDPELSVEQIAKAVCLSRRSLYMLFNGMGETPADFIRNLRVERCESALTDPAHRFRTLTEISADFGFADGAHFSRAFRSRFGVCPKKWRNSRL